MTGCEGLLRGRERTQNFGGRPATFGDIPLRLRAYRHPRKYRWGHRERLCGIVGDCSYFAEQQLEWKSHTSKWKDAKGFPPQNSRMEPICNLANTLQNADLHKLSRSGILADCVAGNLGVVGQGAIST
jgi:hypothetical protein